MTAPDADLTPAFIADLDGIWWMETPHAVVLDREWLRENYGPARYGLEEPMPTMPSPRQLARDTRTNRVGEVMATPGQAHLKDYWLRPVGGGLEWSVPRHYTELINGEDGASA